MVFEDAPSTELTLPADGMPLAEMLATVKLVPSKSEAMRLLKSGGVYVNNVRATDERARLTAGRRHRRRAVRPPQRPQGPAHRPASGE